MAPVLGHGFYRAGESATPSPRKKACSSLGLSSEKVKNKKSKTRQKTTQASTEKFRTRSAKNKAPSTEPKKTPVKKTSIPKAKKAAAKKKPSKAASKTTLKCSMCKKDFPRNDLNIHRWPGSEPAVIKICMNCESGYSSDED